MPQVFQVKSSRLGKDVSHLGFLPVDSKGKSVFQGTRTAASLSYHSDPDNEVSSYRSGHEKFVFIPSLLADQCIFPSLLPSILGRTVSRLLNIKKTKAYKMESYFLLVSKNGFFSGD